MLWWSIAYTYKTAHGVKIQMLVKYGFQVLRSFELQGITDVSKNTSPFITLLISYMERPNLL